MHVGAEATALRGPNASPLIRRGLRTCATRASSTTRHACLPAAAASVSTIRRRGKGRASARRALAICCVCAVRGRDPVGTRPTRGDANDYRASTADQGVSAARAERAGRQPDEGRARRRSRRMAAPDAAHARTPPRPRGPRAPAGRRAGSCLALLAPVLLAGLAERLRPATGHRRRRERGRAARGLLADAAARRPLLRVALPHRRARGDRATRRSCSTRAGSRG